MYRQLQEKVRGLIIDSLCQISEDWEFYIDTTNLNEPLIIGREQNGVIIKTPIEKFYLHATKELISSACGSSPGKWIGCILTKSLFHFIFPNYGIQIRHDYPRASYFQIISKDTTKIISSNIFGITPCNTKQIVGNICDTDQSDENIVHFISPFVSYPFGSYVMKEQLVSPFLLLLDPITYFRKYSDIMKKYPALGTEHTLGIYELLLGYFPEMNPELFDRYLLLCDILLDVCVDIAFLVGEVLVDLYGVDFGAII